MSNQLRRSRSLVVHSIDRKLSKSSNAFIGTIKSEDCVGSAEKELATICLIGMSVGKTSLIYRVECHDFVTQFSTINPTESTMVVNNTDVIIYDTPGDPDRFKTDFDDIIERCEGFMFLFSVQSQESLDNIAFYSQFILNKKSGYHIKTPAILVGTKCEDNSLREVSYEDGMEFAKLMDMDYFETSAITGYNVDLSFQYLVDLVLQERNAIFNFKKTSVSTASRVDLTIGGNRKSVKETGMSINLKHRSDNDELVDDTKKKKNLITRTISRKKKPKSRYDSEKRSKKLNKSKIEYEGWLTKVGAIVHSSRRRWFVLKNTTVKYYVSESKKQLKGSFKLADAVLEVPILSNDFSFQIVTSSRTWKLTGDTKEEMERWLYHLKVAICPSGNFGLNLVDVVNRNMSSGLTAIHVPILVQILIGHLRDNNAKLNEGIFRISGNNQKILDFHKLVDYNDDEDIVIDKNFDIFSVCSALKLYFRELPDPLIPCEFYDRFMKLQDIQNEDVRIIQTKPLLELLPQAHFSTLNYLMDYLHEVADSAEINMMSTQNLSIVFGPTLCRRPAHLDPKGLFVQMKKQYGVVIDLIKNFNFLFLEDI